jgi:Carboxypeptidase regulatory-like domain/TonB-dependent Receptor Plug Domain
MSGSGIVRVLLPALLSLGALYAQGELASITGEVTDSAQAIMPAVNITVRNVDTNIARTIQTNIEGYFTITNLPPGNYELIAEKQGFRAYHETGIVLATGQELRSDIKLSVGAVSDSVTVMAEVAPLNTENGMIKGAVVVQQEINDMPLNGRDFTELALFVPGVTIKPDGGGGSFASINGARTDQTNFLVDGIDDRNIRGAAAQLRPNIDSMQEFKMEVSGYSAEYGKMAGGILNMVLKSGTNSYHGALFEYFRNDFFDAKAYFDASRLPFHQNQWGGVIQGPLSIPKVYNGHDRTFFMFSWESLRNPYGTTALSNVPTALEVAGDFSQAVSNTGKKIVIANPFSSPVNAPFPGNIIPQSLFSPIARKFMQYYPLPNRTAVGNNLQTTAGHQNTFDSYITRGDHRFNDKDSISVTFGKRFGRSNQPYESSNLGIFDPPIRDDRELGGISYTHMFKPTLLSETRFGLSRAAQRDSQEPGFPTAAELGRGVDNGVSGVPSGAALGQRDRLPGHW